MASKRNQTPLASPEDAAARYAMLDQVIRRFHGQLDELESAIGMYMIGHHFGWKVLYLIHSKKTVKKYEEILGLKVSEVFPETGPDAENTNAHRVIQAVSNFWKTVSGEEKLPFAVDKRSTVDKGT